MSRLHLILFVSIYLFNILQLSICRRSVYENFDDDSYETREYSYEEAHPQRERLSFWNLPHLFGTNKEERIAVDSLPPFYYPKRKQILEPEPVYPSYLSILHDNGYFRSATDDKDKILEKFKPLVQELSKFCKDECTPKIKCDCTRFEKALTDDDALKDIFETIFNVVSSD